MEGSERSVKSSGLGDPMALLFYNVFNNGAKTSALWKHSLLIGAGLKLPVGDYEKESDGILVNRNFQLGSGSLDYLFSMNYTLRRNAFGFNAESSFKLNTSNKYDYRFGNQFNSSGYFFYLFKNDKLSMLPYTGVFFESANKHFDGQVEMQNTGGYGLFATFGGQLYLGQFSVNVQYQHPISQGFNAEQIATIKAQERFSIGLLYNFSTKSKGDEAHL